MDLRAALHYCHRKATLFGPLPPSSILLDGNGNLKLHHFEHATQVPDIAARTPEVFTRELEGDMHHLPPELLDTEGVRSYASDFWALGVLLYQLAFGTHPFIVPDDPPIIQARELLTKTLELPETDNDFADLLRKLTARDPRHRPTWAELATHPFFGEELKIGAMPPQEAYQRYKSTQPRPFDPTDPSMVDHRLDKIQEAVGRHRRDTSAMMAPDTPLGGQAQALMMCAGQAKGDSVEELLVVDEDRAIRTIVLNKHIDKHIAQQQNPTTLPFAQHDVQTIADLDPDAQKEWVSGIIASLDSRDLEPESLSGILAFLIRRGKYPHVGILLIQSRLPAVLARHLRHQRDSSIRAKVCVVLGLIHHGALGTTTSDSVTGVVFALLDVIRTSTGESVIHLRRAATGALGEVLFYAARTLPDPQLPASTVATFIARLSDPDRTVTHYVCKTLENLAAPMGSGSESPSGVTTMSQQAFTRQFFTADIVSALGRLVASTGASSLRSSALIVIGRHALADHGFLVANMDRLRLPPFSTILSDTSSRIQLAGLNMLNSILVDTPGKRVMQLIAGDSGLFDALSKIIENTHALFRGKGLLTAGLLVSHLALPAPLLTGPYVEYYTRGVFDSALYTRQCAAWTVGQIATVLEGILTQATRDILDGGQNKARLDRLSITVPAFDRTDLRPRLVRPALADFLVASLPQCAAVHPDTGSAVISDDLLEVIKKLAFVASEQAHLLEPGMVLGSLLPAVVDALCVDPIPATRYHLASCLLVAISSLTADAQLRPALASFAVQHMIKVFRPLLYDHSPIPLTGTKLLALCLGLGPEVPQAIGSHARLIVTDVLGFCHFLHPHLHADVVVILRRLLADGAIVEDLLITHDACRQVATVINDMLSATCSTPDGRGDALDVHQASIIEEALLLFRDVMALDGDDASVRKSQSGLIAHLPTVLSCAKVSGLQHHAVLLIGDLVNAFGAALPALVFSDAVIDVLFDAVQMATSTDCEEARVIIDGVERIAGVFVGTLHGANHPRRKELIRTIENSKLL